MSGDLFGKDRLAMPFDIIKRAVLLDLPDESMPEVKAAVVKIAVDEHIMTGLSGPIKHLGLHSEQHGGFPFQKMAVASSMARSVSS